MAHTPKPSAERGYYDRSCDSAPKSLGRSVPGPTFVEPPDDPLGPLPPTPTVSQVLYQEIDNLYTALDSLEATMLNRLAPIMRQPPTVEGGRCTPDSGFAPLFDGIYSGLKNAQNLVARIHVNLDLVDDL